jgi:hypothetical protein
VSKLPLPDANAEMVGKDGRPTQVWYKHQRAIAEKLFGAEKGLGEQAQTFAVEFGSWVIEFPDEKTYRLIINAPYGFTIDSVSTVSDTGTCTATVKINGTPLGGTANSVSTSLNVQTHESANVVEVGDTVSLEITSNSSCEGMTITIAGTRTL